MVRKIAISTNKGGVLKTSISTNLAGVLSKKGKKVLIIDTDNQGNVLLSFGINPDNLDNTIYDALIGDKNIRECILRDVYENIDILPSNDDMAFFEFDILTNMKVYPSPFNLLSSKLKEIEKLYDYIIIDTPPNLGLTQGNALTYVNEVIIPFQPENYSMRSLVKILSSIDSFRQDHNKSLEVLGVIATLVDQRTVLHSEILQSCRQYCYENNIKMFDCVIPRTIRYASSIAYENLPATLTEKNDNLISAYVELMNEIN